MIVIHSKFNVYYSRGLFHVIMHCTMVETTRKVDFSMLKMLRTPKDAY